MISRFHIEDLIVQDASGVVFRAQDSETGRPVAIRRFFPFGADGGGLHDDEQTAYRIALGRLTGIHHPALRSVIGGGCDPVDGMPFIATEWVDGESLDVVMDGNPLPVEAATLLISQALEVSELLSHVLAEEAVWVETTLDTIVVSQPESGRGFTFWISPLKWLGHGENRGIESIVALAEEAMGWQGRIVNEQAGRGLGAWIKWLRAAAPTTSLHEAREMLAASVGAEPPPPAKTLAIQAAAPVRTIKQPSTRGPLIATLCGIVVVGAAVAWFLAGKQGTAPSSPPPVAAAAPAQPAKPTPSVQVSPAPSARETVAEAKAPEPAPPPAPAPEPETVKPAAVEAPEKESNHQDLINQRLAKIEAERNRNTQVQKKQQADLKAQQAEVDARNGVFSASHHELLVRINGKMATVEGRLAEIGYSQGGNWMYLILDDPQEKLFARGKVVTQTAPSDLKEAAIKPLIGKKIRLRGQVESQGAGPGQNRPLILIQTRAAIQELP